MQPETFISLLARANGDFPAVFQGKSNTALPLAIGTDKALFAAWPDMPRKTVRTFMAIYCGAPSYLRALIAGGPRYRLDGAQEGEVSASDQAHAVERLAALEQRWKEARTCPDVSRLSAASASSSRQPLRLAPHAPLHRRKLDVRQVGGVQVVTIRRRSPLASGAVFQERNLL